MKFLLLILLTVFQIQSAQASIMALEGMLLTKKVIFCKIVTRNLKSDELWQNRMDSALYVFSVNNDSYTIQIKTPTMKREIIVDSTTNKNKTEIRESVFRNNYVKFDELIDKNNQLNQNTKITIIF